MEHQPSIHHPGHAVHAALIDIHTWMVYRYIYLVTVGLLFSQALSYGLCKHLVKRMTTSATRSFTLPSDASSLMVGSPFTGSQPPASITGTKPNPTLTLSTPPSISTIYSAGYTLSTALSNHPVLRAPLTSPEITSPLPSPESKKSVHWAPLPLPARPESYDGKVYRRER